MKADRFAVVIQWGGGHIYFNSFHSTEGSAQLAANGQHIRLGNRRNKRGAKPAVMVWEKKSEGLQVVQALPE